MHDMSTRSKRPFATRGAYTFPMSSVAPYDPNDRLQGLAPHVRELALRGQQALARSNPAHAMAPLDEAMAEYPAHPELLRLRGLCEHFHGRFDAAIEIVAPRLRPHSRTGPCV